MKQKLVINFSFIFCIILLFIQKSIQSANIHNVEQTSDDDEYENNGRNHNEYSSEDDDYETNQIHSKKLEHQLEWDDAAIEYGPKKV